MFGWTCGSVLMVISQIRGMSCVNLGGMTALEPARAADPRDPRR